jgi:hypothetical protein
MARKSKHPDWDSSSFYIPKRVNNAFNKALIDLRDEGYVVDRSDVLTALLENWLDDPVAPGSI